jgi:30S ribosomal protein 3
MTNKISSFQIKVLMLDNSLGVAIEQITNQRAIPLTPYFFWPRNDAWELLRIEINSKIWISDKDKALILNNITNIFNIWQKNGKSAVILSFQKQTDDFHFVAMI